MRRLSYGILCALLAACGGDDDGDGNGTPDAAAGNPDAPSGTPDSGGGTPDSGGGPVTMDSKVIGPAGGTLSVDGAELIIPPDALAADTQLTLTKTSDAAPGFAVGASAVYEMGPDGTTFNRLVTLRITHASAPPAGTRIFWGKAGVANPTAVTDYETLLETTITGNVVEAKNNHFTPGLDGTCGGDQGCPELRCCSAEGVCGGCL
jgi:hypothetical protein